MTPFARAQPIARDPRERQPSEPHHRKAGGLADTMNLPVFALPEHDLEPRFVALVAQHSDLRRSRRTSVHLDAPLPLEEILLGHFSCDLRDVQFRRRLARMKETHGELSVVRQEQRPARVKVQAPDGHDTNADLLQIFGNGRTPLRIVHRADHVAGLVKHEIHGWLGLYAASIHLDTTGCRIGTGAELGHDEPVDGHAPRDDERLGTPP